MPDGSLGNGPTGNVLLDAVLAHPPGRGDDPGRLDVPSGLELVHVELGQVVHEPAAQVAHVFFPRSAVFGLLTVTAGGPEVEAMAVGSEGVVGLAAVLGDGTSAHRALCQVPGQALRFPARDLRQLAETHLSVRRLLGQHIQSAVVLLSQRIVCSQRHSAQQRCADWLLRHADRAGRNPIPVTQQFLAAMLGLRRTTVSAVAAQLQDTGLISYRYGQVTIRDHARLERLACNCYRVFRAESDRLLPAGLPAPH